MRGYFGRKFTAFFLALIFILPISPVGAAQTTREEMRELQQQLDAAGQLVTEQQNLLDGTELQMSQVMQEMQAIDRQLMYASEALGIIGADLLATEIRMAEAEADLEAAREDRDLQMEILRTRVRTMHEYGTASMLGVLLQAESIGEFFSRLEAIRTLAQFDRDLLAQLDEIEEREAENTEELRRSRILITELQFQEERAKQEVARRLDERKIFFAILYEDAERHAEYLAILEEEAHAINIEFGIVHDRYRAELAEAERIRRAEEDARRAAAAAARAAEQEARLASLNSFENFAWPLPGHSFVSSYFGNRPNPFAPSQTEWHSGIDLPAPANTRINAAEAGYVRISEWSASWGNFIIIDHAGGYSTLYAHNTRNRVSAGQRVTRGQHIADVGTTGRSTGNHLHFEIRLNGVHRDPMSYFGG